MNKFLSNRVEISKWKPGTAPVAVIMISLNEAHNMEAVLDNLSGWAQEVFLVDSYSSDATVDIALSRGVQVVQRPFNGFGDQWNFAVTKLPVRAPWTMKLDPDERLTLELKASIEKEVSKNDHSAFLVKIRLWFMKKPIPVHLTLLRLWQTGTCKFSVVNVNEHALVAGDQKILEGVIEHHDSPNLHHWLNKQNNYTTAEAIAAFQSDKLSTTPRLFGSALERRMWLKKTYKHIPFRHQLMFLYCYLWCGAWRAGRVGFIWARLRAEVYRMREYKRLEMVWQKQTFDLPPPKTGKPDSRVPQYD